MSSICLIADFSQKNDIYKPLVKYIRKANLINQSSRLYVTSNIAFCHSMLPNSSHTTRTMTVVHKKYIYTIILDGDISNTSKLRQLLKKNRITLKSDNPAEAVLYLYITYGEFCVEKLSGDYTFIIYDESREKLFIARSPHFSTPLCYQYIDSSLLVSSDIKLLPIFSEPEPDISTVTKQHTSLDLVCTLKDVFEFKPSYYGFYDEHGLFLKKFHTPEQITY